MKSIYRHFTRTIADGVTINVNVYGRFITLLSNTSSTDILVSIDNDQYERLPQGISVELSEKEFFTELFFRNDSGASVTIKFCVSAGKIYDNRVVISGDLSVTDISDGISTPAVIDLNAGNSYTATIAVNANRKEVIIQNCGSYDIWAGDANVDPSNDRGIKIIANDNITIACTALITLKSNSQTTKASIMELTKS